MIKRVREKSGKGTFFSFLSTDTFNVIFLSSIITFMGYMVDKLSTTSEAVIENSSAVTLAVNQLLAYKELADERNKITNDRLKKLEKRDEDEFMRLKNGSNNG